ncbi:MAG: complex I NDUFA9 subunit family protein [Hyphomonas sp.]|nr:complex I NDUFA9 subunit family protein [Hyphomonas sp.]MCB9971011.1 complex I NDUFA9 subunit family protein [Hyphomonas sp.]
MTKGLVTIFGGSGFIGRYAARELVKKGWRVRVACRRVGLAGDVRLAGAPGWVDLAQANVRDRASVERAMDGADAVVNLVGILDERGKQTFESTIHEGSALIAEVAAEKGISRFVQVSAIGADAESRSAYARAKAEAEAAVRAAIPAATILRPSIVFGPEDGFFNKFAQMARFTWFMPLIGGGRTRFQPVYAGDVARAIAVTVDDASTAGQTYELGGPRTYTFSELTDFILKTAERPRFRIGLPFFLARPLGYFAGAIWRYIPPFSWGFLGDVPVTGDQVEMLRSDNVAAEGAPGLKDLGITAPETIEAIVPTYLWRFRPHGQFSQPSEA